MKISDLSGVSIIPDIGTTSEILVGRVCAKRKIADLSGPELDPYISQALGHVGAPTGILYHQSAEIANQLFSKYGESIQRFADGFYCTMKYGAILATQQDKESPILAIYRAYIVSRLGDEV